jgi:thiosulfate/3-mercaptopyruvate sulfurtransferase
LDESLMWDLENLAEAFRSAGITVGDTVVAYCHIGQQATTILLGARLLGHPVKLYDGSFQDWARRDLPVEKGPGR